MRNSPEIEAHLASLSLTPEDIEYLQRNTSYNEMEIREWYRGFKRDCPNGQMSRAKVTKDLFFNNQEHFKQNNLMHIYKRIYVKDFFLKIHYRHINISAALQKLVFSCS